MDMDQATRDGDSVWPDRYETRSYSGDLSRRNRLSHGARIGGLIEHRFPKENPERFRTLLIGAHNRNRLKLEFQDDGNEQISGRQTMTIAHIGRVRVGHPDGIPERLVRHSTTSHVTSMVTQ